MSTHEEKKTFFVNRISKNREEKRLKKERNLLLKEEKPGRLHAQQNNPIRKFRYLYEPFFNAQIPKEWTADDVVFNRFFGMMQATDEIVSTAASKKIDKHEVNKSLLKYMVSAGLDLGDGARARAEHSEPSVRNQLIDVAADRIDETYTATKLGFLLFEKTNDPELLMTALHLARNVSLPTIARYIGNAKGVFLPEKDPKGIGGARYDKVKYLFGALRHSGYKNFDKAYQKISALDAIVAKADTYRRNKGGLHDAVQIISIDPKEFVQPESINLRTNFEIGLNLLDIFFQSHEWIRSALSTFLSSKNDLDQGANDNLLNRYDKEARDSSLNPGSALYFALTTPNGEKGRKAIQLIRENWQKTFPEEFQNYPELSVESFITHTPRQENYPISRPKGKIRRLIYRIIASPAKDTETVGLPSQNFKEILYRYRPTIAQSVKEALENPELPQDVKEPILYHFGWQNENGQQLSHEIFPGKGIRPVLLAMTYESLGGDPQSIAPLGATLELVHNFSLIHDDIEDKDTYRHNRPTLWATNRWGEAHAINSGDYLLILAFEQIKKLKDRGYSPKQILDITTLTYKTVLSLIEGQHRDIAFEKQQEVYIEEYMKMIKGKTGAMIDAAILMAAQLAGTDTNTFQHLEDYADAIGKIFQIRDDFLGIWGNTGVTGKPEDGDIKKRKKSYPVIFALEKAKVSGDSPEKSRLLNYYMSTDKASNEIEQIRKDLEFFGAKEATEKIIEEWRQHAVHAIQTSSLQITKQQNFLTVVEFLAQRDK